MNTILSIMKRYLASFYIPRLHVSDIIEIAIISLLVYAFLTWIKNTRAYTLLKGIAIVLIFLLAAWFFKLNTILFIASRVSSVALIALVIIFQPELRKALESLGTRSLAASFFRSGDGDENKLFSDKTINEIVRACADMAESKTGALIVIEQDMPLTEFIDTGIMLDSEITSQLLINIFEKNTPLHDGAVIIRGDRVMAATCYLPLSDNLSINKRLGTRHRAGIGISEVSNSFTIIVSEETGRISSAYEGALETNLTASALREKLHRLQDRKMNDRRTGLKIWKGREDAGEKKAE